jgi:hypothetical protein
MPFLRRLSRNDYGSRVKGPFQGDSKALLLGPCPVIGEVEALIDQGIDIDRPVLSRALSGMQQHVLDDCVGALAVLHDLVEIALQRVGDLADIPRGSKKLSKKILRSRFAAWLDCGSTHDEEWPARWLLMSVRG